MHDAPAPHMSMLAHQADIRQWEKGPQKRRFYNEMLGIRGIGEKIFGDVCIAMLFGVGISGAIVEIGKAVFFLYLRGKLRNASHDRYKKLTGFCKFTA